MPEKDRCVICWNETKYDRETPVDIRKNYGPAGQLCEDCVGHFRLATFCEDCVWMVYPMNIGSCKLCGGVSPSSAMALCAECAIRTGSCQVCRKSL